MNNEFTERELMEIKFALMYVEEFLHGTDGHNRLMLIAKLAATSHNEQVKILAQEQTLRGK